MTFFKTKPSFIKYAALLAVLVCASSCTDDDTVQLVVNVPELSISKLPFVLALDQGLYAKHGLRAEIRVPTPESEGRTVSYGNFWGRVRRRLGIGDTGRPDITIGGGTPTIVRVSETGPAARQIMIGATDCILRAHIVARKGIASIEELRGGRIGMSDLGSTAGFHALRLAKRMGWDAVHDVSLLTGYEGVSALLDGSIDALVAYEFELADAKGEGLPVLLDTREWDEALAGNSIRVTPGWLDDPTHREAARRFLRATAEAIALFHQQPDLVKQVLREWYGVDDPERAQIVYERGAWIPGKPYPCAEGIKRTMELYDSNEMRRYSPSDFYDDSLMREIDQSGFIDALYQDTGPSTAQSALQAR
jgi:ABC-type nitrate/sulfonate/bicarbonate transport system substrate-binding protein